LGPSGAGPGEYLVGSPVNPLPGDSTLVFDFGNRRAVVVGPDFVPARYIIVPFPVGAAVVLDWPTEVVVLANISGVETVGRPLHLIDLSGSVSTVIRSFDTSNRPGGNVYSGSHGLSESSEGYVWALDRSTYRLNLWDADEGRAVRSWRRDAGWFQQERPFVTSTAREAAEDPAGRLWVAVTTPRPGAEELMRGALNRLYPAGLPNEPFEVASEDLPPTLDRYRTTVEVLDMVQSRVYARTVLDEYLIGLLAGNRAAAYSEDALGVPRISVIQLGIAER
jgi:hypothetical protein